MHYQIKIDVNVTALIDARLSLVPSSFVADAISFVLILRVILLLAMKFYYKLVEAMLILNRGQGLENKAQRMYTYTSIEGRLA